MSARQIEMMEGYGYEYTVYKFGTATTTSS